MRSSKILQMVFFLSVSWVIVSFTNAVAEENPCITCHSEYQQPAKSVHAAVKLGCATCHKVQEGMSHPGQKGSIKLIQTVPVLCFTCHDESKFKPKVPHQPVAAGMCTACHNPHKSENIRILKEDLPKLCFTCHNESKFKGKRVHTMGGMCISCHNPHGSDLQKITKSSQPGLCLSCHDKTKFTKKNVHKVIDAIGCTGCHNPHASDYELFLSSGSINDNCISCHKKQSSGQHVTSGIGLGRKFHPLKGVTDPNFPGKPKKIPDPNKPGRQIEVFDPENPGKEISCISCHDPHSSDYQKLFPVANVCQKCHKYF